MAKDLFFIPLGGEGGGGTGAQGVQGIQGVQGPAGSGSGGEGSQGTQGIQGLQGVSGTDGLQGAVGSQGTAGRDGLQGSVGSQGASGVQGAQGTFGFQGIQGPAGSGGGGSSNILRIEDMTSEQLGNLYSTPLYYQIRGYVCTYEGNVIYGGAFSEELNAMELFSYVYPKYEHSVEGLYPVYSYAVDIVFDEGTGIYSLDYTGQSVGADLVDESFVNSKVALKEDRLLAGDGIAIQSVTVDDLPRTRVSVVGGGGGSQGTQGVQGKQGKQGTFGYQGVQGTFGFQGIQGTFGFQGIQGPAGSGGGSSRLDVSQLSQAELVSFYSNYATEMASKELFWGPYPITSVRDYVYPVQDTPVTFRALTYRLEATFSSGGNPLVNTDMQLIAPDGTVWTQTGMSVELAPYNALQGKQDLLTNTLQMTFTFTDSTQAVYDVYYK